MLKYLLNLAPSRLKRGIISWAKERLIMNNKKAFKSDTSLKDIHLAKARLLPNRISLIRKLSKGAIVAEIGVNKGAFSKIILEQCSPSKLHLIDSWASDRYHDGIRMEVLSQFDEEVKSGVVEIHKGLSTEVCDDFDDAYFDWVYIDTNHSYKTTKQELIKYEAKVKSNGFITGHDFIIGNWDAMIRYGVIEAVYEFCDERNWELVYLTMDYREHPSFAIRRIQS